jgi:ubiquinol-cytochrome c reductase cytochrome b subunit
VRSLSLLTGVLAAVFALGGLVQINPVWIYGPFHPAQATSPAQPDWYVAWGDGALRLFPPIEVHVAGHLIPAPFFPAVGLGTVTFLLLYAWPWLERWRTGDKASHQILERPRDRPGRVAVGAYALTFFAVLLVAAADDIIARLSGIPVLGILRTLQILVLVLPFAVAAAAFLVARSLRAGTATTVGDLTREDLHAGMTGLEESPGETSQPAEHIRLWRNPDDTWRWRWSRRRGWCCRRRAVSRDRPPRWPPHWCGWRWRCSGDGRTAHGRPGRGPRNEVDHLRCRRLRAGARRTGTTG